MHELTVPTPEVNPVTKLHEALAQGSTVASSYWMGQAECIVDITLPEHRTAWPTDATYENSKTTRDASLDVLDARHPDFHGEEAVAHGKKQAGVAPSLTKEQLLNMAVDKRNEEQARRQASAALRDVNTHAQKRQAEIAAERTGWAGIVRETGDFVACPPNGSVIVGRAPNVADLGKFFGANGYRAMPVENRHAQPLVEILAARSGVPAEIITERALARKQQAAGAAGSAVVNSPRL